MSVSSSTATHGAPVGSPKAPSRPLPAGLTDSQKEAILARGNVLVMAGAGTGKTRTLVERCIHCLLEERPALSLDEILIVTFTEAAAAEIRQRIRQRLQHEADAAPDSRFAEQLALFETAHIGTLHSFCLELVRRHFYLLNVDPQLAVLAEGEARLLAEETLDRLLERHYAGGTPIAQEVQRLVQVHGRGWDLPIRTLIQRLHRYAQSLPDAAAWLASQSSLFAGAQPAWEAWLLQALPAVRADWWARLEAQIDNPVAEECVRAIQLVQPAAVSRAELGHLLEHFDAARENCPPKGIGTYVKPIEFLYKDAAFLASILIGDDGEDPLIEDWTWIRGAMSTLVTLAIEFGVAFDEAKRELGTVDFQDLEQLALRLLVEPASQLPTDIARAWRQKLRFIFVDEYQDINAAQDSIISALSREGENANRFLVGDVKQSIYRFRLANPRIFQTYARDWVRPPARVIPLRDNFRSRASLLDFVNAVFRRAMLPEIGGIAYDRDAELRFGQAAGREPLAAADPPAVELHLRLTERAPATTAVTGGEDNGGEGPAAEPSSPALDVEELTQADKEARLAARRLHELHASARPVWDDKLGSFRPMKWSDAAVLLRSPSGKAETYAKEFSRAGVPLVVARGGFYSSLEISDLLSLLQLLDNPLQDIPVVAVLRSPLVGLTVDDLARIRLAAKGPFWTALTRWHRHRQTPSAEPGPDAPATPVPSDSAEARCFKNVDAFLGHYSHWRRAARQSSLSRCLERILADTSYLEWLLTQPKGEQLSANVSRLLSLARQFDRFQRQSLYRFLIFVEGQQLAEAEPELAAADLENAVRLVSIHQSKGLEFPIVLLADLGKRFNESDLNAEIILDEQYGLCPQVKPPDSPKRYPSLPYWLARRRQRRELLGEELRLLYVALTRARDLLVLCGTLTAKRWDKLGDTVVRPVDFASARCYAEWLALWFWSDVRPRPPADQGTYHGFTWQLYREDSAATAAAAPSATEIGESPYSDPAAWAALERKFSWKYPFLEAANEPAKTSVTALRRRAAALFDNTTPARPLFHPRSGSATGCCASRISAADRGLATHRYLQHVSLDSVAAPGMDALRVEAERMFRHGLLSAEEREVIDLEAVRRFWDSEFGKRIAARARHVRRELPFTARFTPAELPVRPEGATSPALAGEFVVVQGVADLAVLLPEEIWLVDFKTDDVKSSEAAARARVYEPQLRLYAAALGRIYSRPVTDLRVWFLACHHGISFAAGAFVQP